MKKHKPLAQQVVVVVGASSGLGRVTAQRFAAQQARVVVAARNLGALQSLVAEIQAEGGEASCIEADVSDFKQVELVAQHAIARYGRIDTWVNFAGVAVYAPFKETPPEEFRRIVEVNLLGQAYGAKVALPYLEANGGALIFISSVEGEVSMPYHSAYAASKHGVNGFVDSLRMELKHEKSLVSVTTIMPTGVNTPFFTNARTRLGVKPKPPKPVYAPEQVAAAVLFAAEHPTRDLFVGGAAKALVTSKRWLPRATDALIGSTAFRSQLTHEPKSRFAPASLERPETGDSRIHGDYWAQEQRRSPYVWWQTHPTARRVLTAGVLASLLLWSGNRD